MVISKQVTQDFLDSVQYLTDSILEYEAVYGENFVSPGGKPMAIEMIDRLALAPGSRVLDVGCGLGGSAFVMARQFGLAVDGIDLSKNMLTIANRKLEAYGLSDQINLQWGDCLELDCNEIYDAVYSRDVFLHIGNKPRLFSKLRASLRAGGKMLFTDYCCGPKPWDSEFSAYVEDRGYYLHRLDEYAELISQAGFDQIEFEDITEKFIEILRADIHKISQLELEKSVRIKLQKSWQQKLQRSLAGDHRWGLFTAVKGSGTDDSLSMKA